MIWAMYWLNYLDRNAITLARLDDMEADLGITETREYLQNRTMQTGSHSDTSLQSIKPASRSFSLATSLDRFRRTCCSREYAHLGTWASGWRYGLWYLRSLLLRRTTKA